MDKYKRIKGVDRLIGICGIAGSGKSTAALHICHQLPYWRYSFASPLKEAVSDLFMIDMDVLDDPVDKNKINSFWGMTPRRIMQLFGTEAMRNVFGSDFWTRQAEERLQVLAAKAVANRLCVVIDDVRFPNEIDWIQDHGGKVLYIYRADRERDATHEASAHASEQVIIPKVLGPQEALVCNAFGDVGKFKADVLRIARRWHYEDEDLGRQHR